MEKVFASVPFSSPLPVAVARTSQSPFPLAVIFTDNTTHHNDNIQMTDPKDK